MTTFEEIRAPGDSAALLDARLGNTPVTDEAAQFFEMTAWSDVSEQDLIGQCSSEFVPASG
jgi:hypothetical protein